MSDQTNHPPDPPRKGRGRPKGVAKKAATAWAQRNREYLRRRSETIEFPEQALTIWREVRTELRDESKHGKLRGGVGKPKGLSAPAPIIGDSIERQVFAKVEHDRLLLEPDESLAERIERWPLPFTFYDPVPPLCPADVDALRKQENAEALEHESQEMRDRDDRLLPGLQRSEPPH